MQFFEVEVENQQGIRGKHYIEANDPVVAADEERTRLPGIKIRGVSEWGGNTGKWTNIHLIHD